MPQTGQASKIEAEMSGGFFRVQAWAKWARDHLRLRLRGMGSDLLNGMIGN